MPFSEHPEHLGGRLLQQATCKNCHPRRATWTIDNTKGLFAFTQLVPDMPVEAAVDGGGQAIERCDAVKSVWTNCFHTGTKLLKSGCGADTPADPLTGNLHIFFTN